MTSPRSPYSTTDLTRVPSSSSSTQSPGWRDVSNIGTSTSPRIDPSTQSPPPVALSGGTRTPSVGLGAGAGGGGPGYDEEGRRVASTGSSTGSTGGKADQIVQHFYSKTCAVISQSRMTHLFDADSNTTTTATGATNASGSGASTAAGSPSASTTAASGGGGPPIARRASSGVSRKASAGGKRMNKWFNLELPETDTFRTELKTWRSVSSLLSIPPSPSSSLPAPPPLPTQPSLGSSSSPMPSPVPPMILDIILDTTSMTPNQVLVLSDSRGRRTRVAAAASAPPTSSTPASPHRRPPPFTNTTTVVLERWVLSLTPVSSSTTTTPTNPPPPSIAELPSVYKHSIIFFRSLFTLIRLLPTWTLYRRLARRRAAGGGGGQLRIGCRMSTGGGTDGDAVGAGAEQAGEIGVEVGLGGEKEGEKTTEEVRFPGVMTPVGLLSLSCTYRLNADFSVEEIETLLSSRFIDEDFFKPTVSRFNQQEAALATGRPGSLPPPAPLFPLTSTSSPSPPLTGLAPLPSYGSLSSRHALPSAPPIPISSSPGGGGSGIIRRTPLPEGTSPRPIGGAEPSPSSGRFSAYGTSAGASGGSVEPAFVSLSRARGASYTGAGGIARASSSSGSSMSDRRLSFTGGASSGSPIFRASSYLSQPPQPMSSGPTSNINRTGSGNPPPSVPIPGGGAGTSPSTLAFGPSSFSSNTRSPLGPSNLGATAPTSTLSGARPMQLPASSSPVPGIGSYTRSSYGRSSSSSSSFLARQHALSIAEDKETKRFLPDAPDDSDSINDFLSMIDSTTAKGEFGRASMAASTMGGGALSTRAGVEEALKALRGSVLAAGGPGTGVGATASGGVRRRESRLSIAEHDDETDASSTGGTERPLSPPMFAPTPHPALAIPLPPSRPLTPAAPMMAPGARRVEGFDIPPYTLPYPSLSHLAGAVGHSSSGRGGSSSTLNSLAASMAASSGVASSFGDPDADGGEAVGRLELGDEDDELMDDGGDEIVSGGRGRWGGGGGMERDRDRTPGFTRQRVVGGGGNGGEGYFGQEHQRTVEEEYGWMG